MENWLWHIALVKILKRLVQILVAWVIGHNLGRFGITVDPIQLSAAIWAALEGLRNWAKIKYQLGWL